MNIQLKTPKIKKNTSYFTSEVDLEFCYKN